ncbi:MAG: hypothetical protein LBP80_04315 [Treponema sp.]|jgi:hypothetical protein|nr:hypothetical protein [Treponema sp.]
MENSILLEWFYFADTDLDSAQISRNAYRQHREITDANVERALSIAEKVSQFAPIYTLKKELTALVANDANKPAENI